MKLNENLRRGFVRAAMLDVPTIDYDEQIRDLVTKYYVEHLPPAVRRVCDDHAIRHHVALYTITVIPWELSVAAPSGAPVEFKDLPEVLRSQIEPLLAARKEQEDCVKQLEKKLRQAVYGCSTVNMLKKQLPEFAKYLPSKETEPEYPVAVANLVTEFMQAGWPASKSP